jgi:hypothetical protein
MCPGLKPFAAFQRDSTHAVRPVASPRSGLSHRRSGAATGQARSEYPYDKGQGFAYEPGLDHQLLIPSAGDARPGWTLDDFTRAVTQAKDGKIAVIQLHGVPDTAHSWVNTPMPLLQPRRRSSPQSLR